MSVKLDKPSPRWVWISVGTAVLVSMAATTVAILTAVHEWRVVAMNFGFMATTVVWLGALTYTAVWWIRRFIAKAVKQMRRQVVDDVINVLNIKDVDRWVQAAASAEPHLKAVPRDVGRN